MKLKRLTAIMVIFTMIAGMITIPNAAMAVTQYSGQSIWEENSDRANIAYKLLGTSSVFPLTSAEDISPDFEWQKSNYVWVGVEVSNTSASRTADITTGLLNIQAGVLYNKGYLTYMNSQKVNMYDSLCVLNPEVNAVKTGYNYASAGTRAYSESEWENWSNNSITGPAERVTITSTGDTVEETNRSDELEEANINMSYLSGSYLLSAPDDASHLLIVYAFRMDTAANPGKEVLQGYATPVSTTFSSKQPSFSTKDVELTYGDTYDTETAEIAELLEMSASELYAEEGYMAYYFNMADEVKGSEPTGGDSGVAPRTPSEVTPDSTVYDKNEDGDEHLDRGSEDRTFTYTRNEDGGLARLHITGTNDTTFDKDVELTTEGITATTDDTTGDTTVVLTKSYLDTLPVDTYTITFVRGNYTPESGTEVEPITENPDMTADDPATAPKITINNPTASLEIKETVSTIELTINTIGITGYTLDSADSFTITYEADNPAAETDETADPKITTTPSLKEGASNTYLVTPNVDYTITATYKEGAKIALTTPSTIPTENFDTQLTVNDSDDSTKTREAIFTIGSAENDEGPFAITITYGLADPTVAVTAGTGGSVTVTPTSGGSAVATAAAGTSETATLDKNTQYTVTATPTEGYVFNGWRDNDGDITNTNAADSTGSFSFTATPGTDSAITADFYQLKDVTLNIAFNGTDLNDNDEVKIYEGTDTTGILLKTVKKSATGTDAQLTIKELTAYTLVATAAGQDKFVYWNDRTTDTGNYSIGAVRHSSDMTVTANFSNKTAATLTDDITHDIKTNSTKDETFTYTSNDYPTITSLTLSKGGTTNTLTSGQYTVEDGATEGTKTITITAATLNALESGDWTLSAVNGMTTAPSVTITITDSSKNKIVVAQAPTLSYEHGDKISLDGMKVRVEFEDTTKTTTYTYSKELGGWYKGDATTTKETTVPFKVVYGDDDADFSNNTEIQSETDVLRRFVKDSSITKAHDGLSVIVIGTVAPHENSTATAGTLSVAQKQLDITGTLSEAVSKTYDQGTGIDGKTINVAITDGQSVLTGDDATPALGTNTGSFANASAADNKPISYDVVFTGADAANYAVKSKTSLSGDIKPIALTVGAISNIPETTVGATKTGSGTATVSAATTGDTATLAEGSNAILTGDSVTFTYSYEYTAANVASAGSPVITITSPASQNGNYTVTTSGVTGTVTAKNITGIALTTKTEYDYAKAAEHTLDLSDTYVTITYGDSTTAQFDYDTTNSNWKNHDNADWTISLDDMPLTWNEAGTTTATHGEAYTPAIAAADSKTKLYVAYDGNKADAAITTKKITISSLDAPVATGDVNKVYDSDRDVDNVTGWSVAISSPSAGSVLATDYDKLAISTTGATAQYDNKNVGTNKVITLSGLALTDATSVAEADKVSGNYILGTTSVTTTGNISKRDLTLTKIDNVPAATQYDLTTKVASTKPTSASSNATGTSPKVTFTGVQGNDVITMTFNYEYTDAQVNDENVVGKYAVTLAKTQITEQTLTGDSNTNYNLIIADNPEYNGTVNGVSVTGASLAASHKTGYYTYIDQDKLDLTDTVVTVTYGGTTSHTYTAKQESDGTVKWKLNSSADYDITNPPFTLVWSDNSAVTPLQTLKPSEMSKVTMQVKVGANKYSNESITVAPKTLTLVHAEKAAGDIEKYYNGTNALTTANAALLSYKAGYTNSESNVVYPTDVTANVTATYGGTDAGTEDLDYTINSISNTTDYRLDASLSVSTASGTPIQGTIKEREIKVTVKAPASNVQSKNITDSDKTAALILNTNYTVSLENGNAGESNALVSGDGVSVVAQPVTYTNDLGTQSWTIPSVTSSETSDYFSLDGAKKTNYKLSVAGGTVNGSLVATNYTLSVTATNGQVTVTDADSNNVSLTSGKYNLTQTLGYTVAVTPNSGYHFEGWEAASFDTFSSDFTSNTASDSSVAITMPGKNLTATAVFKLLPVWVSEPNTVDKSQALQLRYNSGYDPADLTINGVTFKNGTDYTVSNEIITLPAAKVATIPVSARPGDSDAANLTLAFTGAPSGNDTLTAKVGVANNAAVVTTLTRVKSPTDMEYTYGETLDLDGMEIELTTTQTNETDKVTTYKYVKGTGWVVKNPGDADFGTTAATLDSKIVLTWNDTAVASSTPAHGDVMKPSAHDANKIKVTYNNDATNAKTTDALEVNKKQLSVSVSATGISKTYDATDALGKDASDADNADKITIDIDDNLTGDALTATINSSKFNNANAGANKPITIAYKISGDNVNEYYVDDITKALSTETFNNSTNVKGEIKAKEITISELKIPSISVGETNLTQKYENVNYATFKTNATLSDEILEDDRSKFTFTVKATYTGAGAADGGEKTFTKSNDDVTTTPSGGNYVYEANSIYPGMNSNYTFIWPDTASGRVNTIQITDMVIKEQPTQTKTATAATHGDALDLNSLVVRLTTKEGNTIDVAYGSTEWDSYGLSISWKDGSGHTTSSTPKTNGSPASHYVHNGAKLTVTADLEDSTQVSRDTDAFIVNPVELTVNVSAADVTKAYDGTTAITAGTLTPSISSGAAATGDDKIVAANIVVSAAYPDIHKGDGKALTTPTLSWNDTAAEQGANYTLKLGTTSTWTGNITARPITIGSINVDKIYVRGTDKDRSETALNITDSKVTIASGTVASGDTVKLTFTAAYGDVSAEADPANVPITASSWTVTGKTTAADDYAITFPANATGKIEPKTASGVTIRTNPTKRSYIHGETLDLTGMQLDVSYSGGGNDDTYTYGTSNNGTGWFLGTTVASDATPVATDELPDVISLAWNSGADKTVTQGAPVRYDSDHFVSAKGNIIVNNTPATNVEITVNKRLVNLEIAGAITKEYDSTLNYGTSTVTTPVTYTWTETGVTGDPIATYDEGNLTVDNAATTLGYKVKNVHAVADGNNIDVGIVYTAAHAALANNYTITVVNNTTTAITPATLKVASFTDTPIVKVVDDPVTGTLTAAYNKYTTEAGYGPKGTDRLTVVYPYTFGEHGTDAKNDSVTVTKNGDASLTGTAASNYTLEVPESITGRVINKTINGITVTPPAKTVYVHGDTFDLTGAKIQLNYNNNTSDTFVYGTNGANKGWFKGEAVPADGTTAPVDLFATTGVTAIKWVSAAGTDVSGSETMRYDDAQLDSTTHKKPIYITYQNDGAAAVSSIFANIEVQQKTIDKIVVTKTADFAKTYDATKNVVTGGATYAAPADVAVGSDVITLKANVAYPTEKANRDKDGNALSTPIADYAMEFTNAAFNNSGANNNGNYKLASNVQFVKNDAGDALDITGTINKLEITFASVPAPQAVQKVGAPNENEKTLRKTGATIGDASANANTYIILDAADYAKMPSGDMANLKADYTVTYADASITTPKSGEYETLVTENRSIYSLNASDTVFADNYEFNWPTATAATRGIVVPNAIEFVGEITPPEAMSSYHTDDIKLKGMKFEIKYEASLNVPNRVFECDDNDQWTMTTDGTTTDVNLADYGISIIWTTTGTEATGMTRKNVHDGQTLTVKAASTDSSATDGFITKATTSTYTVNKLPIYAKVTPDEIEKVYDGTTAVEAADKNAMTFSFYVQGGADHNNGTETAYDPSAIGDVIDINKTAAEANYQSKDVKLTTISPAEVTTQPVTVSNLALTGAAADYYELKTTSLTVDANDEQIVGKITPAPFEIEVTGIPAIWNTETNRTNLELPAANYTISSANGYKGEDGTSASASYFGIDKITYSWPDVEDSATSAAITFNTDSITLSGAGADQAKINYDIKITPTVTGTINAVTVTGIAVSGPAKKVYTHRDDVDLDGLKVTVTLSDGSTPKDYTYTNQNGIYNWLDSTGAPISQTPGAAPSVVTNPFGDNEVEISFVNDSTDLTQAQTLDDPDNGLIHLTHDNARVKVNAGALAGISSDKLTVNTMPLYAKARVIENQEIGKQYDAQSAIGVDDNNVENKTKLEYTLAAKDGDNYYDYVLPADEEGKVVIGEGAGYSAKFVKNNAEESNVQYAGDGWTLFSVNNLRYNTIENLDIAVSGLAITGDASGNYDFNGTAVGDKPQGKIYPRDIAVTATEIGSIKSDYEGSARTVNVTEYTMDPDTYEADIKANIEFEWTATYDADGQATVNNAQASAKAKLAAANPKALYNYDFKFEGTPDGNVTVPQVSDFTIIGQPEYTKSDDAVYGDKVSDKGGVDGLEITIDYDKDPVTGDAYKTTHHKLVDGEWFVGTDNGVKYEALPEGVSFKWNDDTEGTPVTDVSDLTDPMLTRGTDKNKLAVTVEIGGTPTTKTTDGINPAKKPVGMNVAGTYTKPYDGTDTITLDTENPQITVTVNPDDVIEGDTVTATIPGMRFTTADVTDNNPIILDWTGVGLDNDNYEIKKDNENNVVYTADDTFTAGAIEARAIKVVITAPTIKTDITDENKTITKTAIAYNAAGTADTYVTDPAGEIKNNDAVTLKYSGTYVDVTEGDKTTVGKTAEERDTVFTFTEAPAIEDENLAKNYSIESYEIKYTVEKATVTPNRTGGGGGGGSTNSLTIHYENEDGTAGDDVSKIEVPLGTDPANLIGVIKTKIKDMTVLWTSDNEEVATVDENGIVTYVGEGTATITAQSKQTKSLKDTVVIKVTAPEATPTPAPTEKPDDGGNKRTHERVRDSLITKTMLNPYIVGYDDYVFGPELPISREELSAIFARLIANNLYMDQDYDTSFPDVPEKWSKSYIGYLEGFEVVTGYEDGNFRPENNITRAEMAVMMAKAEGYDITPDITAGEAGFPDVDEGYATWSAAKAIQILSDLGIMSGYEDGTFRPGQPITRAETVATVNRVLAAQEVADRDVLPSDVTNAHWAYEDIVFAMNHRILKDASADPNAFIWSEEFDKNMITTTEQGETETVTDEEAVTDTETITEEADSEETSSGTADAEAPKETDETSTETEAATTEN